jgi:hypothetical protein
MLDIVQKVFLRCIVLFELFKKIYSNFKDVISTVSSFIHNSTWNHQTQILKYSINRSCYHTCFGIILPSFFWFIYLMTLSIARLCRLEWNMIPKWWIGKDLEGGGRGLLEVPFRIFAWRKWGKSWKASFGIAGVLDNNRTEYLPNMWVNIYRYIDQVGLPSWKMCN